jgi:hypothetical protein
MSIIGADSPKGSVDKQAKKKSESKDARHLKKPLSAYMLFNNH